MNTPLFIKDLQKSLNPNNTYVLFFMYVVVAIYLILLNDLGAITIDKSTFFDIGAINQPLIDLVNTKYPTLSKYHVIVNYLYLYESGSGEEHSLLEYIAKNFITLIVVFMFSAIVIFGAKFIIAFLQDKIKTLYINGVLFLLTNIYFILYPLHAVSRGCAAPILFTEMLKAGVILFTMLIASLLFIGVISLFNFFVRISTQLKQS